MPATKMLPLAWKIKVIQWWRGLKGETQRQNQIPSFGLFNRKARKMILQSFNFSFTGLSKTPSFTGISYADFTSLTNHYFNKEESGAINSLNRESGKKTTKTNCDSDLGSKAATIYFLCFCRLFQRETLNEAAILRKKQEMLKG